MSVPLEKIESDLLKLPRDIRAHLAEVLSASLEEEEEIADEWAREGQRRLQEILAGEVETISAADAIAQLRARLRS